MAEEKKAGDKKLERIPTAKKRDKQNEKARLRNRSFKAKVRTALRSFEDAVTKGDKTVMQKSLSEVFSLMDKGVKTGCFKLNKASRTKSRLASQLA